LARLGVEPDAPVVTFHDPLRDRQADAAALVFAALVQALEHLKHALGKLHVDPDAIVCDREHPFIAPPVRLDANARGPV